MWAIEMILRKTGLRVKICVMAVLGMVTVLASCGKMEEIRAVEEGGTLFLVRPDGLVTRASPDECRMNDINFFVFDEDGRILFRKYVNPRQNQEGKPLGISVDLPRGVYATVACCANLGYELGSIKTLEDLRKERFHLAYPDEFKGGLPMVAVETRVWDDLSRKIDFPLKRLVCKISVSIDRSGLDKGVKFNVTGAALRNVPRSASLVEGSRARNSTDVFAQGYVLSGKDADLLNVEEDRGVSRELDLYMLENLQGVLLEDTVDDQGKVLEGPMADVCSYVELKVEYLGADLHSGEGPLVYRFYVGEDNSSFDSRRNHHYHFRVCPMGDGLGDDGWRLDKSKLTGF